MSTALSWEFKLLDRVSGNARSMRISLEGVDDAIKAVSKDAEKAGHSSEGFMTKLHHGLALAEKAWGLAERVADVGLEFGKAAIEAASFKETTLVSLDTVIGGADAAADVFRSTITLASKLPIETQAALNAVSKFSLAGYKPKNLSRLVIAASDVKAFNPGRGDEAMHMFERQIAEIKQVGLGARHLLALSQETNIGEDVIKANLAKMYGTNEKNIEKMISKKLIDKEAAVTAIMQAVAQKEGGRLGTISKKLGRTVDGLFSTLKSRKLEVLMDLDGSPAYASFRGFLSNLVSMSAPGSTFESRVRSTVSRTFGGMFTNLFGDFSGADGAMKMELMLTKALRVVELIGGGLQAGAGFAKGLFTGLASGLNLSNDLFGPDGALDSKKLAGLVSMMQALGEAIGKAIGGLTEKLEPIAFLLDGKNSTWSKITKVADTANASDPMQVLLKGGYNAAVGAGKSALTSLGLRAPEQQVDELAAPRRERAAALAQGFEYGWQGAVNIDVDARGATEKDAAAIAKRVARVIPNAVSKAARQAPMRPARG